MSHTTWPPNGNLSQWICDQFDKGYRGWCIDVGASDGFSINTTFAMERYHGWNVLSVEANPEFGPILKGMRTRVEMCACGAEPQEAAEFHINDEMPESFSALEITRNPVIEAVEEPIRWRTVTVPVTTVDALLTKWDFPRLDVLCVDVEGGELEVLKGANLPRWKPKVVVSEAWDSGSHYPYLHKLGYKLVARNVHNDIFKIQEAE